MATYQIKVTHSYPEQLRQAWVDGPGLRERKMFWERIPNHPTRPARSSDWNCWWEDLDTADVALATLAGATVRFAPTLPV